MWLRRHKNKDNLSNLNAAINFTNQKIEKIANTLNILKKEKDRTYNSDDWFEWSEGRISFLKKIQMVHHQEIFIVMVFQSVQIGLKKKKIQCMVMFFSIQTITLILETMAKSQ